MTPTLDLTTLKGWAESPDGPDVHGRYIRLTPAYQTTNVAVIFTDDFDEDWPPSPPLFLVLTDRFYPLLYAEYLEQLHTKYSARRDKALAILRASIVEEENIYAAIIELLACDSVLESIAISADVSSQDGSSLGENPLYNLQRRWEGCGFRFLLPEIAEDLEKVVAEISALDGASAFSSARAVNVD